jgi:hypothetical protein
MVVAAVAISAAYALRRHGFHMCQFRGCINRIKNVYSEIDDEKGRAGCEAAEAEENMVEP